MRGAVSTVVVFLSLVVLFVGFASVYAQEASQIPPLSVKTELPLYDQGDSVVFNGMIKTLAENNIQDVTLRVIGPLINGTSSNIVQVKQIRPQLDGSFEGNFIVSGPLWQKRGDYKIIVNYGPQKAEAMFFYNGGTGESEVDVPPPPPPPQCGEGEILKNNQCVPFVEEGPKCGVGTVLDPATGTCVVASVVECQPGETLVNGQCVAEEPKETEGPICGEGTRVENGICVPVKEPAGGQCAIATAAFGSELAPQVQMLREIRDNVLFSTGSGTAFMAGFNDVYYLFSPTVADWERQNPAFKELVKTAITPMLSSLSILNYVDIDSEQEMLGYGIGIILLNIGMYFVAPALVIVKVRGLINKKRL
ncbi:MAG: CFI-box-CTERM domain-containing protein [Candidatus Nitrosotenuis sp.]